MDDPMVIAAERFGVDHCEKCNAVFFGDSTCSCKTFGFDHLCDFCGLIRLFVYWSNRTDDEGRVWEQYQCSVCEHLREFAVS